MKIVSLLMLSICIVAGCSSSDNNRIDSRDISDIVSLNPPEGRQADSSVVYIDSTGIVNHKNSIALLVAGDFPDGCTHLKRATHEWVDERLSLTIAAWRDPDMMCTQALTPFTFIYDQLSEEELAGLDSVRINGTTYPLQ